MANIFSSNSAGIVYVVTQQGLSTSDLKDMQKDQAKLEDDNKTFYTEYSKAVQATAAIVRNNTELTRKQFSLASQSRLFTTRENKNLDNCINFIRGRRTDKSKENQLSKLKEQFNEELLELNDDLKEESKQAKIDKKRAEALVGIATAFNDTYKNYYKALENGSLLNQFTADIAEDFKRELLGTRAESGKIFGEGGFIANMKAFREDSEGYVNMVAANLKSSITAPFRKLKAGFQAVTALPKFGFSLVKSFFGKKKEDNIKASKSLVGTMAKRDATKKMKAEQIEAEAIRVGAIETRAKFTLPAILDPDFSKIDKPEKPEVPALPMAKEGTEEKSSTPEKANTVAMGLAPEKKEEKPANPFAAARNSENNSIKSDSDEVAKEKEEDQYRKDVVGLLKDIKGDNSEEGDKKEDKKIDIIAMVMGFLGLAGGLVAKFWKVLKGPLSVIGKGVLKLGGIIWKGTKWLGGYVWKGLKLLGKPLGKLAGFLGKGIMKLLGPVGRMIGKFLGPIGKLFGKGFMKLLGPIGKILSKFLGPLGKLLGPIGKLFGGGKGGGIMGMVGGLLGGGGGKGGIMGMVGNLLGGGGGKGIGGMLGNIAGKFLGGGGGGGIIGKLSGGLLNKVGGGLLSKVGGGLMSNVGGKLLGKVAGNALKAVPGIGQIATIGMAAFDAFKAVGNAAEITGKRQKDLTFRDKAEAGVAGALSGLTMGLVDVKTMYKGVHAVTEFTKDVGKKAWEGLKKAGSLYVDFVKWEAKIAMKAVGWVKDTAVKAWNKTKEIAGKAWEMYTNMWKKVGGWIKGAATKAWEGLKKAGSWIKDTASKAWEGLKKAGSWIKDTVTKAWEGIKNIASKTWDAIVNAPKKLWEGAKSIAKKAWDGIKNIVGQIRDIASEAWAGIKSVASKVWNKAKDLANKAWEGAKEIASKAWNGVKKGWNMYINAWKKVGGWIKEGTLSLWGKLKTAAGWIKEKAHAAWEATKTAVADAWDSVKNAAKNAWDRAKEIVSSAWNGLKEKASEAWTNIKNAASEAWEGAKSFAADTWAGIKQTASDAWAGIKSAASDAWAGIKDTASSMWEGAKSFANKAKDFFTEGVSTAADVAGAAFSWIANKVSGDDGVGEDKLTAEEYALKMLAAFEGTSENTGKVKDATEASTAVQRSISSNIGETNSTLKGPIIEELRRTSNYETLVPHLVGINEKQTASQALISERFLASDTAIGSRLDTTNQLAGQLVPLNTNIDATTSTLVPLTQESTLATVAANNTLTEVIQPAITDTNVRISELNPILTDTNVKIDMLQPILNTIAESIAELIQITKEEKTVPVFYNTGKADYLNKNKTIAIL